MQKILFILIFFFSFLFGVADSDRALKMMKVEQRVALVIGNNSYDHDRLLSLKNPVNDAQAMRTKLQQLGFKVIYGENLRVRDMDKKLRDFGDKIKQGGVGLFFFAGHGIESDGKNYLLGKNSNVDSKDEIAYESLELNKVLEKMEKAGNRLNIVMLDACRNDPFSRSGGGGLAKSTARGTFIAYATSPGDVASDGNGKNGVFTQNILKHIDEPGVPIERLFKNVKRDVVTQTHERQRPWTNSDIIGDFFFVLPGTNVDLSPSPVYAMSTQPVRESRNEEDFGSTITHNGNSYATVTSPYTGKVWLDRNLGASRVCQSFDDVKCYGKYYEFGKASCPIGFRVPTKEELKAETISQGVKNRNDAFKNFLKLPSAGYRYDYSGGINARGTYGYIWSSSPEGVPRAWALGFFSTNANMSYDGREYGRSVRCIMD